MLDPDDVNTCEYLFTEASNTQLRRLEARLADELRWSEEAIHDGAERRR